MSLRNIIALLALVPAMAWAQSAVPAGAPDPVNPVILSKKEPVRPNALTMQVIMAQKHTGISDEQWRKMMLEPVNASLYPIRITQAMLDTLDATQLDMRYRYEMVKEADRRP